MPAVLFRDLDIRGLPAEGMTEAFAERLGRALGTLARQKGSGNTGFVVGREPGDAPSRLRDGLVRGLVLAGQHVTDVGVVDARRHEFAAIHLARPSAVYVTGGDEREPLAAGFEVQLGGGPLVGEALRELQEVTDRGDFSAGAGTLELFDAEPAYLDAERQGDVPGLGRDTQVI